MDGTTDNFMNAKYSVLIQDVSVGKTSRSFNNFVTDESRKVVWFAHKNQVVAIDSVTRRPKSYGDEYKKYFKECRKYNVINYRWLHPDCCTLKYDISSNCKTYKRTSIVSSMHIDINNHANQSTHVGFCFDCLAEAVATGFCANMTDSIFKYPLRRYSTLYLKELNFDDTVDTIVWQNDSNPWVFHFHVMKTNQLICQVELEFFESYASITAENIESKL